MYFLRNIGNTPFFAFLHYYKTQYSDEKFILTEFFIANRSVSFILQFYIQLY